MAPDDVPYLSFNSGTWPSKELLVTRWSGTAWDPVGSPMAVVSSGHAPLTFDDTTLRVAYAAEGGEVESRAFETGVWQPAELLNPVRQGPGSSTVQSTIAGGGVVAAWAEDSDQLLVARRDAAGWTLLPMAYDGDAGIRQVSGVVGTAAGDVWVAFIDSGDKLQILRLNR